jgi:hypothetical protein
MTRRLTPTETNACRFLKQFGERGFCPAFERGGPDVRKVEKVLRSLVNKGRVSVEDTDDGPLYRLTADGEADAS